MASSKISLKLLVDTKTNKVLFAEAVKEFVDFLFTLLSLPVGAVIRLLDKSRMVGSLGSIYASLEGLSEDYMQPGSNKDSLLKPTQPESSAAVPLLIADAPSSTVKKAYMCGYSHRYITYDPSASCPQCSQRMSAVVTYVAPLQVGSPSNQSSVGYVKSAVTYMVYDDLGVKPMSAISGISILKHYDIKEIGVVQEKTVQVTMSEGLKLLKASLETKEALTTVFFSDN